MEHHDPGLFGPDSVSWQVLREATVMIGGVQGLLMHAAHPLVVAGARQTGMYATQPWQGLERTLRLTFTVVFGSEQEARAAVRRFVHVHAGIHGVADLVPAAHDWRNPVVEVVIQLVR